MAAIVTAIAVVYHSLRAAPLAEAWRNVEVMPDPGVEVL
jgi:hypothetical protein